MLLNQSTSSDQIFKNSVVKCVVLFLKQDILALVDVILI